MKDNGLAKCVVWLAVIVIGIIGSGIVGFTKLNDRVDKLESNIKPQPITDTMDKDTKAKIDALYQAILGK